MPISPRSVVNRSAVSDKLDPPFRRKSSIANVHVLKPFGFKFLSPTRDSPSDIGVVDQIQLGCLENVTFNTILQLREVCTDVAFLLFGSLAFLLPILIRVRVAAVTVVEEWES